MAVLIESHDHTYLSAEGSHVHFRTPKSSEDLKHHEHFHWVEESHGSHIALKSHNNHYISINSHHEIHLVSAVDNHTLFHKENVNGHVAYKSAHGGIFLGVHGEHAKAHHGQVGNDQQFHVISVHEHGHHHHDHKHHH